MEGFSISKELENLKELEDTFGEMAKIRFTPKITTLADDFGKIGNENFLSDWLTFLLNPQAFGNSEPLKRFLSLIGKKEIDLSAADVIRVYREYGLGAYGRIDLLIQGRDFVVGIENKIYSTAGENQLANYAKALEKLSKDDSNPFWNQTPHKVFLAPDWNDDKESNGFVKITYNRLYEAFADIARPENCGQEEDFELAAEKNAVSRRFLAAFLLNDFLRYIKEHVTSTAKELDWEQLSLITKKATLSFDISCGISKH